jgi:SPP1 gp7 family putative phage head morphogenesis protein
MRNQRNSKFIELIKLRRSTAGRRGLRRRAPRWLFPAGLERDYTNQLVRMVDSFESDIKRLLFSRLPSLAIQAQVTRADDFLDDIKSLMAALNVSAASIFGGAEQTAFTMATRVMNFSRDQYKRIINATLGVDPISTDDYLRTNLKAFAQQNASLIKSIPQNLLTDVEGIVTRGLTGGATIRDMERDIKSRLNVSKNKARLIASDQIGKLNGQMTKLRQERVGVIEYIWNTSGDERVRHSHRVLDGKICRWDDDTVYRNPGETEWLPRSSLKGAEAEPGEEIRCRCWAEPVMDDLIEESF